MKWIKASEKIPRHAGNPEIHYRIDGFHKVQGNFHYSIDDDRCEGEIVFTVLGNGLYDDYQLAKDKWSGLEWLDESIEESAIQLIRDIRHGNVYNDIPSICEKWLIENGYEKL